MTAIVVGGHSRNVGKTSVAAGLIRAFRKYPWTAIKISSHRHANIAVPSNRDPGCFYEIFEEESREGTSDTSRFLAAGACRSLWMRIDEDHADTSMRQLQSILQSYPFVVIESNRILSVIRPDLYIMVLKYDTRDFKDSARKSLKQADAVVAVNPDSVPPPWEGVSEILSDIPQFATPDPRIIPEELIDFVESKLSMEKFPYA
jgi:hypothetical protein